MHQIGISRKRASVFLIACLFFLSCGRENDERVSVLDVAAGFFMGIRRPTGAVQPSNEWLHRFQLTLGQPADIDGDGSADGIPMDFNGDGKIDSFDSDRNGVPDQILLDIDGDGFIDALDSRGSGIPDYYACSTTLGGRKAVTLNTEPRCKGWQVRIMDSNADGSPDGYDTDFDGLVDNSVLADIRTDFKPPSPYQSAGNPQGLYHLAQTITISCADDVATAGLLYSINGDWPRWDTLPLGGGFTQTRNATLTIGQTVGNYLVRFSCRDMSGRTTSNQLSFSFSDTVPGLVADSPQLFVSGAAGANNTAREHIRFTSGGQRFTLRRGGTNCASGVELQSGTINSVGGAIDYDIVAGSFTGEGQNDFKVYSYEDNNSNGICDPATDLVGQTVFRVTRDDTPPFVTASPGGGDFTKATSVSLTCFDAGVGCQNTVYLHDIVPISGPNLDGVSGASNGIVYLASIADLTDGATNYLTFRARDRAGNVSPIAQEIFRIDSRVPTVTLLSVTFPSRVNVSTMIGWQSDTIGTYSVRVNGSDCLTGREIATGPALQNVWQTAPLQFNDGVEGWNTIRVCVTLLNTGSASRQALRDSQPPTISIDSPAGPGVHPAGTMLSMSCADLGKGCYVIWYTLDGSPPVVKGNGSRYDAPVTLPVGSYSIRAVAADWNLNVSSEEVLAITVSP